MVERNRSHKKLKGLSAIGTSVLFIASCTGSEISSSDPLLETPRPLPSANETFIQPTIRPIETPQPTPTETEKTLDELARETMLNVWVNTLNSGVTKKEHEGAAAIGQIGELAINTNLEKPEQLFNQTAIILSGGKSEDPISVLWAGGSYTHSKNNPEGSADKWVGGLEINNVFLSNTGFFPITDVDKANGISWHGNFQINYIERYHGKQQNAKGNYNKLVDWVIALDGDLPDFSPWYENLFQAELLLQNGQWVIASSSKRAGLPGTPVTNLPLPHDPMLLVKDCNYYQPSEACRIEYKTISIN